MKNFKKNLYIAVFVLVMTVTFSLVQVPKAYSVESTTQDKAVLAISEVIGLDMTKYKTELTSNAIDQPEIYGGLTREILTYTLRTDVSRVQVICTFINETLTRCAMYPLEGSLLYAKPLSSDVLTATNDILQRYQQFSGAAFLQQARSVLNTITEIKTMNATLDNLKLQVTEVDNFVDFTWWQTVNDVDFPSWLSVEFVNGELKGFSDRSSFYHIGSSSINISRDQAIQITREQSKGFTTLQVPKADGTYIEVTFTLTDEHMVTELQVANREPLTMYPVWYVRFYFDKPYGGTDGFQAGIWADTGEIAYSQLTGHHGLITEDSSVTPDTTSSPNSSPNTQPQSESSSIQPLFVHTLIIAIAITIAVTIIVTVHKRKSR